MASGTPPTVGRLAPTPSGHLHLGNAVSFAAAWLSARAAGGQLLLRFEDVDQGRARLEVEEGQRRDLDWLGLHWDREVTRQSERDYEPVLAQLSGQTYRCTCTRAMTREAGGVYPGTCRDAHHEAGAVRLRLPPGEVEVHDRLRGARWVDPASLGDPVLRRRDGAFTYALAVVADDIADGITEVVRGADLFEHTSVQQRLWQALGATPPTWLHGPLVLGPDGKKLSKSHGSLEIRALRAAGWEPPQIWELLLTWLGLEPGADPEDAVRRFRPEAMLWGPLRLSLDSSGAPSPKQGVLSRCPPSGGRQ